MRGQPKLGKNPGSKYLNMADLDDSDADKVDVEQQQPLLGEFLTTVIQSHHDDDVNIVSI